MAKPKGVRIEDSSGETAGGSQDDGDKRSALVIQRVSMLVSSVAEMTAASIDPLLAAADIEREIFLAALVKEFCDSLARADDETAAMVKAQAKAYISTVAHQAASMGLVVGSGPTGRQASIIFRKRRAKVGSNWQVVGVDANVQPEWRGVIQLIKRANPDISDIKIELIGRDDIVEIDRINDTVTKHVTPAGSECEPRIILEPNGFDLIDTQGGYAVVSFKSGLQRIVRVSRADMIRSAAASETLKPPYPGKKDMREVSPWVCHTKPMCYKTVALAIYRKPDVWSPSGGSVFNQAHENLQRAYESINLIEGNRIVPPAVRDERVDQLLIAIAPFGGDDRTLTHAAKQLGYDDPSLAIQAGKWASLIDRVKDVLHA